MPRPTLAGLAGALVVALAGCAGAEGPTQPDIDPTPRVDTPGLEDERRPDDVAPAPSPGESPIDTPDDPQPGVEGG